jgi:hypothetical protein
MTKQTIVTIVSRATGKISRVSLHISGDPPPSKLRDVYRLEMDPYPRACNWRLYASDGAPVGIASAAEHSRPGAHAWRAVHQAPNPPAPQPRAPWVCWYVERSMVGADYQGLEEMLKRQAIGWLAKRSGGRGTSGHLQL